MNRVSAIGALAIAVLVTGCDDGHLRGAVSKSPDGKTYFAVADDNGGQCGPMIFDGAPWPHSIGEAAEIKSGEHSLECGTQVSFDVPPGVIFKFDYWGP